MILAAVDPGGDIALQKRFRGKNLRFWYGRRFPELSWLEAGSGSAEISCLILFDPEKYLDISAGGMHELITLLQEKPPAAGVAFALDGFPLYVLGPDIWKRMWKNGETSIIGGLRTRSDVELLRLRVPFRVVPVHENPFQVEMSIRAQQVAEMSAGGVEIEDCGNFYIEGGIPVGRGTTVSTGVVIKGASEIGEGVKIHPYAFIENSVVGANCHILPFCVLRDSVLENDVQIGPFTHLRNNSLIRRGAKAGNFVELKKSVLGEGSKSMHLSYLGDAGIGEGVNIGAGTITCNYDGENKHPTTIEDGVFIGSGTELVAPVRVGKGSYVAAGSTITEDVPEESLGIARGRQVNKPGWAAMRKKKK
jgi:bifunctional UDP-N-acetylglucosamine pyrophosphorylase/glucosamine-1-phosphate N-acetyltransferase